MDPLRSSRLLTRSEYSQLRATSLRDNPEEQARVLLNDILPKKQKGAFQIFCGILLRTPGQEHIVTDVLKLRPRPHPPGAPVQDGGRPRKRIRSESLELSAEDSCGDLGQRRPSGIRPTSQRRITFYFKEKHRQNIRIHVKKLYALCEGSFGVSRKGVKLYFEKDSHYEKDVDVDGVESYVCEGEDDKLVNIVVYGVSAAEVEEKHPEILDSIAAWLDVERNKIELKGVKDGSAVMILRMQFVAYFGLLCSLSEPHELFLRLHDKMPSMSGAQVVFGGLPPIFLDQKSNIQEFEHVVLELPEQCDGTSGIVAVQSQRGSSRKELQEDILQSLTEDSWTSLVLPSVTEISDKLKPNSVMDRLRARGILSRDEFRDLLQIESQTRRSLQLVEQILPSKGVVALQVFCEVLLQSEDQSYIVRDFILSKIVSDHLTPSPGSETRLTRVDKGQELAIKTESDSAAFGYHNSSDMKALQEMDCLELSLKECDVASIEDTGDRSLSQDGQNETTSLMSSTAAICACKVYEDLVSQLRLIEENPFELVWKTSQEQNRKRTEALFKFVEAVLDRKEWQNADLPAILDSIVSEKNLFIPALEEVKQHWEKRVKEMKAREEIRDEQSSEQSSEAEPLKSPLNVYHCVLLCQAVSLGTQGDAIDYLNRQPSHNLEGVAISDSSSPARYLIATSRDVVYAAFKGSDQLNVWMTGQVRSQRRRKKSRQGTSGRSPRRWSQSPSPLKHDLSPESIKEGLREELTSFFSCIGYLPLRYFARLLISRKRVIFTGHSLGGTTAVLVTVKLLMEHFQATEENVACVTFGQLSNIVIDRPPIQKMTEMHECFHSFISKQDIIPRSLDIWTLVRKRFGTVLRKSAHHTSRTVRSLNMPASLIPLYSKVLEAIDELAEGKEVKETLEQVDSHSSRLEGEVRPFLEDISSMFGSCLHELTPYRTGKYYILDSITRKCKEVEAWTVDEELELKQIPFEEAAFPAQQSVTQHSIASYLSLISEIYANVSKSKETSVGAKVEKLRSVVPTVTSTGFHMRGTDQVVVTVEGDNMWFVTQVDIARVKEPLLVEPCYADKRSVSVVLSADDVDTEGLEKRRVVIHSHFSEKAEIETKVVTKKFEMSSRQKQLAAYSPSEIMEMAFLQALLERRIKRSSVSMKDWSERFKVVSEFVEEAIEIVPVESIFHGTANSELFFSCMEAASQLLQRRSTIQMSEMLMTGIRKAIEQLHKYLDASIHGGDIGPQNVVLTPFGARVQPGTYVPYPVLHAPFIPMQVVQQVVQHWQQPMRVERREEVADSLLFNQCKQMIQHIRAHNMYLTQLGELGDPNLEVTEKFLSLVMERINELTGSAQMVQALCGLNVKEVYLTVKQSKASTTVKTQFEPPVDMLRRHRQDLNELAQEQEHHLSMEDNQTAMALDNPSALSSVAPTIKSNPKITDTREKKKKKKRKPTSEASVYTNQKMLKLVTSMRRQFKTTSVLLGSFMEARIRIPFTKSKPDDVEAMFAAATNKLGVGVWALFSLPEPELRQLLSHPRMHTLVVNVAQFLGECSEIRAESRDYAGKLQFIVNSMRDSVNASGRNVHYWLERQLVDQCRKLRIPKGVSLDELLEKWDDYFKDDALSLVTATYRPLVGRWFKWSLVVHNLRETLASYVAVGVIGLVNSGKSRLVEELFGVRVLLLFTCR
jgi:hypothetical protein